MIYNQKLPEEA